MTALLTCPTMTEHLPDARENAQRTYDRRRARAAADTLALIPPNRWDDHTRQVVATLATISAPSRIDDVLDAFDGEPADHLITVESPHDMPTPYEPVRATWEQLPEGTTDLGEAFAAELDRMDRTCERGHLHGAPESAAACNTLPGVRR